MYLSHIELRMLEEMYEEREERRRLRETLTREELERLPREEWDDRLHTESWEERYFRRQKERQEQSSLPLLAVVALFFVLRWISSLAAENI